MAQRFQPGREGVAPVITAIRATSRTLADRLQAEFADDPVLATFFRAPGTMRVYLNTPAEMSSSRAGLSVWLYRVVRDDLTHNEPPARVSPSSPATRRPSRVAASDAGRTSATKASARSSWAVVRPAVGSPTAGAAAHGMRVTSTTTSAAPSPSAVSSASRRALTRPMLEAAPVRPSRAAGSPGRPGVAQSIRRALT